PLDRGFKKPDDPVTIEGYINHKHLGGYKATEANYWLFFFFAPRVFWRTIGRVGHRVSAIRQGMILCAIGGLLLHVRHPPGLPRRIRDRLRYAAYMKRRKRETWRTPNDDDNIPF